MSNAVGDALRRVVAHLDGLGVSWALVGGFAVSVRVEPRFTRDVDVAVAVADDRQAEDVVGRLTGVGYRVDGYHRGRDLVGLAAGYLAGS